jgi:hypothetical protein
LHDGIEITVRLDGNANMIVERSDGKRIVKDDLIELRAIGLVKWAGGVPSTETPRRVELTAKGEATAKTLIDAGWRLERPPERGR